jgi:hypothetical protein
MTPHEKAQLGLKQIEDAVIELLALHGDWMSRPDIARELDIESYYKSGHGGYLSGGICKTLVERGILETRGGGGPGQTTFYRIKKSN